MTFALILALGAGTGCAARARGPIGLPPIPARSGPLVIDVVYPPDSARISARDSNFIFGSVGNGQARLTINGEPVTVEPNGAFLAWLPVPGSAGDTLADYELIASLDDEEVRAVRTVRLPPPPGLPPADSVAVDMGSVVPRGGLWVRPGEIVPVRVKASPGASVRLLLPEGDTLPLRAAAAGTDGSAANWIFGRVPTAGPGSPAAAVYEGELTARRPLGRGRVSPQLPPVPADIGGVTPYCAPPVTSEPSADTVGVATDTSGAAMAGADRAAGRADTASAASTGPASQPDSAVTGGVEEISTDCAVIEVVTAGDTARVPLPLDLWILDRPGPVVELREQPSRLGRDGFVVGRAAPGATTLWMWSDGVRARVTGRRNGWVRLALDERTEAWVSFDETVWLRGARLTARARVGTVRIESRPDRLEVRVSVGEPVPYHVAVDGTRVTLTLYGAYSDTNWLRYGPEDPFLVSARWEQPTSDRYRLQIDLARIPWGYRARYAGGALLLELRKPPPIDPERPLADRVVVVDPGHPPAGARGPTRLYEGDANLAVAYRLKRLLEKEGARVYMTRADRSPVRLYDRTLLAEMLGADVLISIHNNALPDGVNPFENHGTSVYYFQPQSLDLAESLQRHLLRTMGLADLGIGRASLALARPTWMPAALTEGAFMMIPAQEAALRDPGFEEAYARGVLEGLREFLAERAE